ncbi:MAG TPA: cytochrome P450 [Ktedonobacteraceae bacterium]|nr:cytochrome P450 [Ktedonobacteraceae bacterium]
MMDMPEEINSMQAAFSLFGGEHSGNPFPLLAQMRTMGAVLPVPFPLLGADRQVWMVTRLEEAVRILKDPEHFTVDSSAVGAPGFFGQQASDQSESAVFLTSRNSMLTVDEPDHRRLRLLVSKAFTPRYMESLRPRVQAIADTLLDQVQAQGQMDIVKDYAFPLPINVISEMLGVPPEDRAQIRVWSAALASGLGLGKHEEWVATNTRAFGAYTAQLVAEKRQHPADDLISQLIAIEEEGDRLSEAELLSMITLLIFAGHETTSNLIATGTLVLLDHPDQLEKLKADLSLVPSAVEELLRFNGPAMIVGPRFAKEEIEIAGQQIQRGDVVIPVLHSANRDERAFTQPDELDIARALNRHIAFGQGIHTCLGAPLARLEGTIALTTLLTRMPNFQLGIPRENLAWHFSLNAQNLTALPISF